MSGCLRPAPAGLVGLLLLSGCAVMRIDVDVYKGPLADHEDVQVQQFAAMAVGAKPLLIQLRDALQWEEEDVRDCVRATGWYDGGALELPLRSDIITPGVCGAEAHKPWNERANRVNAVLRLYDDKDLQGLAPYLESIGKAIIRYEDATGIFDRPENAANWKIIEAKFRDFSTESNRTLAVAYQKMYGQPLPDQFRNEEDLQKASETNGDKPLDILAMSRSKAVVEAFENFSSATGQFKEGRFEYKGGSNERYAMLKTETVLNAHASALFEELTPLEVKKLFKRNIREFADAYFAARQALRTLWSASLDALAFVEASQEYEADQRRRLKVILANAVAFLTQERYLASAIYAPRSAPVEVTGYLGPSLEKDSSFWLTNKGRAERRDFDYDATEKSLARVLLLDTQRVIVALRQADNWLRSEPENELQSELASSGDLKSPIKRQFGVVRGPTVKLDEIEVDENTIGEIASIASELSAESIGFEDGRLQAGLNTLITDYLTTTTVLKPNAQERERRDHTRNLLLEAMVRFAKKVLIIADNDRLLRPPTEQEQADAFIGRGASLDQYVLVLQAVGNSIRIQADELRHRERHGEGLQARAKSERAALAEVIGLTGPDLFDHYYAGLAAVRAAKLLDLTQVLNARAVAEFADDLLTNQNQETKSGTEKLDLPEGGLDADLGTVRQGLELNAQHLAAHAVLKRNQAAISAAVAGAGDKGKKLAEALERVSGAVTLALDSLPPGQKAGSAVQRQLLRAKKFFDQQFGGRLAALPTEADDSAKALKNISDDIEATKAGAIGAIRELKEKATAISADDASVRELEVEGRGYETALTNLRNARSAVLRAASEGSGSGRQPMIKQAMKKVLDDGVASVVADKKGYELARTAFESLPPPDLPGEALLAAAAKSPDSEAVLDDLIAMLRHELLQAIKHHGKASPKALQLADALKMAYDQRAGMAFIRPSGAYLRSSYPATGLQDDPRLGWSNMLGEHGLRTAPGPIGFIYNKIVSPPHKAIINAEIDKQFWQTINSVRVAGAGNTNYVIAKDDVGNWYVKSYSSDPEPIIESAKSLALFSLGPQFDSNLLERAKGLDGTDPLPGGSDEKQTTQMGQVFVKHRELYVARTNKSFEDVQALVPEQEETSPVHKSIVANWQADSDTKEPDRLSKLTDWLVSAEKASFEAARTKLGEAGDDVPKRSASIVSALLEVKGLLSGLEGQISSDEFTSGLEATLTTAEGKTVDTRKERDEQAKKVSAARATLAKREQDTRDARLQLANAPTDEKSGRGTDLDNARKAESDQADVVAVEVQALTVKEEAVETAVSEENTARTNLERAKNVRPEALRLAAQAIASHIKRITRARFEALAEYENAIVFIGDVNNPKTAAAE